MSPRPKKSIFVTESMRNINPKELRVFRLISKIIISRFREVILGKMLGIPVVFNSEIARKIIQDHGIFPIENLIISLKDWEYLIRNVNGNENKINLIKKIPGNHGYFTIGANKVGSKFHIVTFYETTTNNPEKIKNLLRNKGDALDRTGRAVVPSFATAS